MPFFSLLIACWLMIETADPTPPIVVGRAAVDVDDDGRLDQLTLVWTAGRYSTESSACFGGGYHGSFVFRVALASGETVDTSLGSLHSIATCFARQSSPFQIVIADYNHDRRPDFNIGSYGNSLGGDFEFFTLLPSGTVAQLPIPPPGYLYVTGPRTHSTTAFQPTPDGFIYSWWSTHEATEVSVTCTWQGAASAFACREVRATPRPPRA